MKLLAVGLIWQFVLAIIILYREEGNIRRGTISRRFWLNHPVSASTGKTRKALWWGIFPLIMVYAFLELSLNPVLMDFWIKIFPFSLIPGEILSRPYSLLKCAHDGSATGVFWGYS